MTFGLTCALALSSSSLALGQTIRVAVIHEQEQDEAARRVRAEVSAAGFDALDVPVLAAEPRSTERIALTAHAVAALRVHATGELELLVIDAETGKVLARESLEVSSTDVSVRAVEDLRAKLVELAIAPPGQPAQTELPVATAPKDAVVAAEQQPPAHAAKKPVRGRASAARVRTRAFEVPGEARGIWLQAAIGGSTSAGGLTNNVSSRFGLRVEPFPRWSVSGLAILPLTSQRISSERGRADVQARIFGASLGFVPLRAHRIELGLGLGAGAVWAHVEGFSASATDQGRTVSVWAACGFGELTLAWQPVPWLRLRSTALAGGAFPRPTIHFDGSPIASWGRPFALGILGVEVLSWAADGAP